MNCQSMLHDMILTNTITRVASKTTKAIMSLETCFNKTVTRDMFVLHSIVVQLLILMLTTLLVLFQFPWIS